MLRRRAYDVTERPLHGSQQQRRAEKLQKHGRDVMSVFIVSQV